MRQWITARLEDGAVSVTLAGQRAWNEDGVTATATLAPSAADPDVVALTNALTRLLARHATAVGEAAIGAAWRALERAKETGDAPAEAVLPPEGE